MTTREDCKKGAGVVVPVVNRGDCEGKRECEKVCPYQVFEVRTIDEADYRALPFFSRLKVRAHGKLSAYTPRAEDCHGCGLCVKACPEDAILLTASDAR